MSWAKKWFLKDPNSCFVTHWPPSVSTSWKSNSTLNPSFFLSSHPNSRELWLTRISAHDGQRFINCSQDGHTVVSVYLCTVLCITMQYPQADTGQIHRRVHTKVAVSWVHNALYVKFIYSEKATKFCEICPFLLTTVHTVKSKGKISQNCGAFSEYMNFNHISNVRDEFC